MARWGKVHIATFNSRVQEGNDLPEDQKKWCENIDEWLSEDGRWVDIRI